MDDSPTFFRAPLFFPQSPLWRDMALQTPLLLFPHLFFFHVVLAYLINALYHTLRLMTTTSVLHLIPVHWRIPSHTPPTQSLCLRYQSTYSSPMTLIPFENADFLFEFVGLLPCSLHYPRISASLCFQPDKNEHQTSVSEIYPVIDTFISDPVFSLLVCIVVSTPHPFHSVHPLSVL